MNLCHSHMLSEVTRESEGCEPANDPPHSLFKSYDDMEFTIVFQSTLFPTVFYQVRFNVKLSSIKVSQHKFFRA